MSPLLSPLTALAEVVRKRPGPGRPECDRPQNASLQGNRAPRERPGLAFPPALQHKRPPEEGSLVQEGRPKAGRQESWAPITALLPIGCVTWDKPLFISESQFPLLSDDINIYPLYLKATNFHVRTFHATA